MHRPAMFSTADAALKSVPGSERIVGYIPLPIHTMSSNEPSFLCQSGNENRLPAFSRLFYSQSNVESVSSRMLTGLFGVDKNKCSITAPSIHACPKKCKGPPSPSCNQSPNDGTQIISVFLRGCCIGGNTKGRQKNRKSGLLFKQIILY